MKRQKKKSPLKGWMFWVPAIPLAGCALALGFSLSVLRHAGEYLSPDAIIDKLASGNGVYGPALAPKITAFKQRLYERYTPDTVALGSSRIDQMRAEDFSVPFVNLGGAETLEETIATENALFDKLRPKAVILAPDDWWFLKDGKAAVTPRAPETAHSGGHDLYTLAGWYATGDLKLSEARTILSDASPNVGLDGILHGDGFDRGGSYTWNSIASGSRPAPDAVFAKSLDDLSHGNGIYGWGDKIDEGQWQKFIGLLDDLQQRGIRTIILLPPFAPQVLDTMASSGKFGYIDALRLRISETAAAYQIPLFDDHDLRFAGSNECEFIDGAHPGTIALRRILLDMAMKDPDLRTRLKLPEIGWNIAHFKGNVSTLATEADFLKLGCHKSLASAPVPPAAPTPAPEPSPGMPPLPAPAPAPAAVPAGPSDRLPFTNNP